MTLLRCLIFLQITATFAVGQQPALHGEPSGVSKQPEAVVRSLFRDVLERQPVGIPRGTSMNVFAPYLSKALLNRIDMARACYDDWVLKHPDSDMKPPFAWLESGLFSGDNEQASPHDFEIERIQAEKDGSLGVYVKLTWEDPPAPKWTWQVAVIVLKEDAHFVVDDVVYLKDENRPVESRLSEYLSAGCDGPHWVGYGNKNAMP